MRFFKVFNLLHRRTKSATFVSGVTPNTLDFASAPNTNLRSSSFSLGLGCRNSASLSLFDLVTENPPPVPSNFNHITNSSDRVLGLWRPRRFSDRNSLASMQSSMNKECARLSEAVNFWIFEYTKIQNLLRDCHQELKSEKQKSAFFEQKLEEERREKAELRTALDRYESCSSDEGFSGDSSTSLRTQKNQIILYPREHCPSVSSNGNYLGESSKPRTLDEYACALRMTLTTRKELRDQKKVTRFWKNIAITGGQQDTITPSVSTISSLLEVMSEDRQAAVQALISRRGMSSRVDTDDHSSKITDNAGQSEGNVGEIISHDSLNTITSALSNSAISRLGPLASESMKQEVNLLFGSSNSTKWLSTSRSRRSLEVSKSTSFKGGLSASLSLNIESFDDISTIFQRAFGLESRSKRELAGEINHENDAIPDGFGLPDTLPGDEMLIASSSSSCLPDSLPSSYSQMWVNVDTADPSESEASVLRPLTNTSYHSLKFATKECTARRSWQKYVAKTTLSNRHKSNEELPLKDVTVRRPTDGKENGGFSMSLPAFKRKASRLPIPAMKNGN